MSGTATTTLRTATLVAVLATAVLADPAAAAQSHLPIAGIPIPDLNPIDWVGDGLGKVKDVVFGTFKMGAKEIGQLIGTIVVAILDMLVPDWVVDAGPKVIAWIVEIENWGRSGGQIYSSINSLQGTLKWIGITLMTTGGTWSALRVLAGNEAVEDVIRAWAIALFGILLFRWGWGQATQVTNSITEVVLIQPGVAKGLTGFVGVIGGGAALAAGGGLVLPILMILAAIVFVGLLAAKTMLLIVGALVYVTGQFAFALRVWPAGHAILRAWWSLAAAVFAIPLAWTLIFAVGGVMISDAVRAGAGGVIEMNAGKVFQSWMLAIAAVMTIVVAIKAAQAIFAMAKMAPLALVSSIGGGGLSGAGAAAGAGSSSGKTTGGRSAGQAAQSLRSSSERSMDSAATGDALAAGKQAATVRVAQAAGTYFGGPAGGAAAGAVAQRVTGGSSGSDPTGAEDAGGAAVESNAGSPGTVDGSPQTPVDAVTEPGTAAVAETTTSVDPAAVAAQSEGGAGAQGAITSGDDPEPNPQHPAAGPQPETPGATGAPTNGSAPADPATPAAALAAQAPEPSSAATGSPAAGTSIAGLPAEPAAAEQATNGGPPAAPAAADRSIAGLPVGDARSAFGIPDTSRQQSNGSGPQNAGRPAPEPPQQPQRPQRPQAPDPEQPGGGEQ